MDVCSLCFQVFILFVSFVKESRTQHDDADSLYSGNNHKAKHCKAKRFIDILEDNLKKETAICHVEKSDIYYDYISDGKGLCKALSYYDFKYINHDFEAAKMCLSQEYNFTLYTKPKQIRKIQCSARKLSGNETIQVQIINSTALLDKLNSIKNMSQSVHYCAVVMFYAPWCPFCARTAPHFNALARAFSKIDVYAIDAVANSNINFRFGVFAVPNILLFHNSKVVARYNISERTLDRLSSFITNVTGLIPEDTEVLDTDYEGPIPSKTSDGRNWYLWLAWAVIIFFTSAYFVQTSAARNLWNTLSNHLGHIEHAHID